jgi:hypothetical protein
MNLLWGSEADIFEPHTQPADLRIDYRFAAPRIDQYALLAKELVALQPELILAQSTQITATLKQEAVAWPFAAREPCIGLVRKPSSPQYPM